MCTFADANEQTTQIFSPMGIQQLLGWEKYIYEKSVWVVGHCAYVHIQDRIGYPQKCPKLLNLQRKPIYCVFADQIIFIPRWEGRGYGTHARIPSPAVSSAGRLFLFGITGEYTHGSDTKRRGEKWILWNINVVQRGWDTIYPSPPPCPDESGGSVLVGLLFYGREFQYVAHVAPVRGTNSHSVSGGGSESWMRRGSMEVSVLPIWCTNRTVDELT